MRTTIQGSTRSLEGALQVYNRLTHVPISQRTRRAYLTARENRRSALPILRQGVACWREGEFLLREVAEAPWPISLVEMGTQFYTYRSLATTMSRLILLGQRYELPLLARTSHGIMGGGREYRYTLTRLGTAVMVIGVGED
jgi:hypothetical protein